MTRPSPLFYRLWRAERRRCQELRREVHALRMDLAATRAHFALAIEQRDRARDLAVAIEAEPVDLLGLWTPADDIATQRAWEERT